MKVLYTLVLILTFSATHAQTKFVEKQSGHIFYLSVPDYMSKTSQLNDAAGLQYQNTVKEAYVIVIEDAKEELKEVGATFNTVGDFYEFFMKDYQMEAVNRKVSEAREFKANNNNCMQGEISFTQDETNFYFLITTVESKTHFYKILCWTLLENKDKLKEDFLFTAASLKD